MLSSWVMWELTPPFRAILDAMTLAHRVAVWQFPPFRDDASYAEGGHHRHSRRRNARALSSPGLRSLTSGGSGRTAFEQEWGQRHGCATGSTRR